MALISCPECSYQVSDRAATCPSCGLRIGGAGVVLTNIEIPFGRLIELLVKVAIAAVPAGIIVGIVAALTYALIYGAIGAM